MAWKSLNTRIKPTEHHFSYGGECTRLFRVLTCGFKKSYSQKVKSLKLGLVILIKKILGSSRTKSNLSSLKWQTTNMLPIIWFPSISTGAKLVLGWVGEEDTHVHLKVSPPSSEHDTANLLLSASTQHPCNSWVLVALAPKMMGSESNTGTQERISHHQEVQHVNHHTTQRKGQ